MKTGLTNPARLSQKLVWLDKVGHAEDIFEKRVVIFSDAIKQAHGLFPEHARCWPEPFIGQHCLPSGIGADSSPRQLVAFG